MNRLEKLMLEIKRQLLPLRHDQDIERSCERWSVNEEDCMTAWVSDQLANCRKKNRCERKGLCVYYAYSDLAKKNYEVCKEVLLMLENGDVGCIIRRKSSD